MNLKKSYKYFFIPLLFLVFLVGCDDTKSEEENAQLLIDAQNPRQVEAIIKNSTYLTDSSKFLIEKTSDVNGQVDISEALKESGYLGIDSKENFVLGIKGESDNNLSGMLVSYWIDKESSKFNMRVVDPNGNLNTMYMRESIDELLKSASKPIGSNIQKGEVSFIWFFRLISIGMRVCNYTHCLEQDKELENLKFFNLYMRYTSKQKGNIYEGTVVDFYTKYSSLKSIPFIFKGGEKDSKTKGSEAVLTATGALKFESVEKELLPYLRRASENIWLSDTTNIKVESITVDGNQELLIATIDKRKDEKLYDLKLNVVGHVDYNFDGNGLLNTIEPEFFAKVKINGVELVMLSGESSYTSSDVLKNVPLKKGDEIEVTIYDDDTIIATRWSKIHTFKFKFDGKKVFNESKALTTTLEFLEEGKEVVNNAPKYNVKVTITGDPKENKDEGKTLPDFSGVIYIDGKAYTIKEQTNKLVNQQVVKDVPINLDDNITVVVMEENLLWKPKMLMKYSFIFDANDVVNENKKLKLQLEFTEQ